MASLQTLECILLGSADANRWSNSVDWCGSNFYDPHTSVDQKRRGPLARERHCGAGLTTQEALPCCCRHRLVVVVGLTLKKEDEWAKYRSNNACVGVLKGAAVPCCQLAIYQGLSNDGHQSALFVCSVCTGQQRARVETCIAAPYRTISRRRTIARSRNRYEPYSYGTTTKTTTLVPLSVTSPAAM